MRARLAAFLHRIAERLAPSDDEPVEPPFTWMMSLDHLAAPIDRSDPIDFDAMWRGQVSDGAAYIEENDVYRGGTYL